MKRPRGNASDARRRKRHLENAHTEPSRKIEDADLIRMLESDRPGTAEFLCVTNEQEFRAYDNPLYVWEAYGTCRSVDLPLPPWVLKYFDRCLANLDAIRDDTERSVSGKYRKRRPQSSQAVRIAEAFAFKSPGRSGAANPFRSYIEQAKSFWLVVSVARDLADGKKLYIAIEDVATANGLHKSTVARAWSSSSEDWRRWLLDACQRMNRAGKRTNSANS